MSIGFFVQLVLLPVLPDVKIEWSVALSRSRLSTAYCNLNLGLVCAFSWKVAPPCPFLNRKLSFTQLGYSQVDQALAIAFKVQHVFGSIYDFYIDKSLTYSPEIHD